VLEKSGLADLITEYEYREGEYRDYIAAMDEAADSVVRQLQDAESKVKVRVIEKTKWRDRLLTSEPVTMPADCLTCLPKIEFDYSYQNPYFHLDDVLRWNPNTRQLESDPDRRKLTMTDKFHDTLVDAGVVALLEQDNRIWRVRGVFTVDAGLQDDPDDVVTGAGVGIGVEFINLRKPTGADLGITAGITVVPEYLKESHVTAGVDWRFFRNVSVGAAYGRSFSNNMILIQLHVFPFD